MEVKTNKAIDLLHHIKTLGGVTDENGMLHLPEVLGTGYVQLISPLPELTLMLLHCELNNALTIRREEHKLRKNTLLFSFRNIAITDHASGTKTGGKSGMQQLPAVQVSTADIALEIDVPARVTISNLIIGIDIDFLKKLLPQSSGNNLIGQLVSTQQSYLYEEIISPKIQSVANEIFQASVTADLALFFYRLKAEELIWLFLSELLKREKVTHYAINQSDIDRICSVKNQLLADLESPPVLDQLARHAGMSVSKLGRLFRQVFGDSIYNYYQKLRMQQAAFLLVEEKLSVSEAGYRSGFSNLSHFTRLFEKHMGMTPKKYSKTAT